MGYFNRPVIGENPEIQWLVAVTSIKSSNIKFLHEMTILIYLNFNHDKIWTFN